MPSINCRLRYIFWLPSRFFQFLQFQSAAFGRIHEFSAPNFCLSRHTFSKLSCSRGMLSQNILRASVCHYRPDLPWIVDNCRICQISWSSKGSSRGHSFFLVDWPSSGLWISFRQRSAGQYTFWLFPFLLEGGQPGRFIFRPSICRDYLLWRREGHLPAMSYGSLKLTDFWSLKYGSLPWEDAWSIFMYLTCPAYLHTSSHSATWLFGWWDSTSSRTWMLFWLSPSLQYASGCSASTLLILIVPWYQ